MPLLYFLNPPYFRWWLCYLVPAALAFCLLGLWTSKIKKRGVCTVCGYDLRATPDRCPECGTPNMEPVEFIA